MSSGNELFSWKSWAELLCFPIRILLPTSRGAGRAWPLEAIAKLFVQQLRIKKEGRRLPSFPAESNRKLLQCDELLARNVCSGVAAARWVEADHTGFIGAERALAGRSHCNRNG